MPLLVLKIDVDTYRGTREGVPNLVRILSQHQAKATFLFSLGPDHTGWALRRALRPGFFSKVSRTSVVEHYGIKTLLYGTLLPGPDIGKKCADHLRAVQQAGFECGIHTWDHVVWQDNVRQRDAAWTKQVLQRSYNRFTDIFGVPPKTHGAAGWQMNPHAFAQLDAFDMQYASDGRLQLRDNGLQLDAQAGPHRLTAFGKSLHCIQLPTTLPTLDELLGRTITDANGHQKTLDLGNIAEHILQLTCAESGQYQHHVYTLHAELEGQKLAPVFAQLLRGWQAQGYQLACMQDLFEAVKQETLPTRSIEWGELPGRSGELIIA